MPTIKHLITAATAVLFVPLVHADEPTSDASNQDSSWIGVVVSDATNIRCGANESYYPIATANAGDLVRVHGNRHEWLQIETSGSVFNNSVGYVKYPADNTTVFSISGATGTATSEAEVLAKNIDSDELYRSWRPIYTIQDGDSVYVTSTTTTEPGDLHKEAYIVHTVRIPASGVAWINASSVTRATDEQVVAFETWPSDSKESVAATPSENFDAEDEFTDATTTDGDEPTPISIAEVEAAWNKIASEAVMGAEVSPLRDLYTELLENNKGDLVITRIATGRIKQLDVWAGLQEQRVRINKLRAELAAKSEKVSDYQSVMSMYGDYAIVGRLGLSNTFDGRLRPFMYRIQEPKSGRTLGYLPTHENWDLSALIGQTIGVAGSKNWDPNWRVNVVVAQRFDILAPTTTTFQPSIQ